MSTAVAHKTLLEDSEVLTPRQLAQRLQLARATVYGALSRLGPEDGVYRFGPKMTRIYYSVLCQRIRDGHITFARARKS